MVFEKLSFYLIKHINSIIITNLLTNTHLILFKYTDYNFLNSYTQYQFLFIILLYLLFIINYYYININFKIFDIKSR